MQHFLFFNDFGGSRGRLARVSGRSWRSWGGLEHIGVVLGRLAAVLGRLGAVLERLGTVLGRFLWLSDEP